MSIEKKKRILIPLNNPRPPSLGARIVVAALRPPLLVLGFVSATSTSSVSAGLISAPLKRMKSGLRTIYGPTCRSCSANAGRTSCQMKAFPSHHHLTVHTSPLPWGRSVCVFVAVAVTFRSVLLLNLLRRIGRIFGYWLMASVSGTLPNPGRPTLTHWRVSRRPSTPAGDFTRGAVERAFRGDSKQRSQDTQRERRRICRLTSSVRHQPEVLLNTHALTRREAKLLRNRDNARGF